MSRLDNDQIITGDTFDELPSLSENSVHAIVTDPPYGLAFMRRDWDDFEPKEYQEWCEEWACEALRVLKPGGHMLAFSGNRTHHRLFTGVEDAGLRFGIRSRGTTGVGSRRRWTYRRRSTNRPGRNGKTWPRRFGTLARTPTSLATTSRNASGVRRRVSATGRKADRGERVRDRKSVV